MLHRQQVNLAKFKRLVLHPALAALCAADAVGYYVTRVRLDAAVPLAAEPTYANAGARYAPSQPPIADFALPREPAQVGLVGDQFAEPWVPLPDSSAPIAELAEIEPGELPAADGTASAPAPRQRALIALAIDRAVDHAPNSRVAKPGHHSSAERNKARIVAAEFARAFPAHFATRGSAAGLEVANVQTAADLARLTEPGDRAEAFAAPMAADQVGPDRRGDVVLGTEQPAVSNIAQPNGSLSPLDPTPSDIAADAPVDQPSAVISQAEQIAAEAVPVVPQLAVRAAAAVHPKVQHTAKRLSAAQPLAVSAGTRVRIPSVSAIPATQHNSKLVIPAVGAAPRTAITYSLAADLAAGGAILDGHIAVRLGDLLDAFELAMDRAEFERMSRSPNTVALVTLAMLRGAGIPVRYNAAERTVAAAGGAKISAATLG